MTPTEMDVFTTAVAPPQLSPGQQPLEGEGTPPTPYPPTPNRKSQSILLHQTQIPSENPTLVQGKLV